MAAQTRRLGRFEDGRLLVFGGPYSNRQAVEAFQKIAQDHSIPPERIICTGDVIGYCGEPQTTWKTLRDWGIPVIKGNVEESLAADAEDCGCDFVGGSVCDRLSAQWYGFCREALSAGEKRELGQLPDHLELDLGGFKTRVIHGAPSHISRFLFASDSAETKRDELDQVGADIILGGHCGIPFAQQLAPGKAWVNAGVVGMPANDGTSRVWYLEIHLDGGQVGFEMKSFTYDYEATVAGMQKAGLPVDYQKTLRTGIWPGNEILPKAERGQQGIPLERQSLEVSREQSAPTMKQHPHAG